MTTIATPSIRPVKAPLGERPTLRLLGEVVSWVGIGLLGIVVAGLLLVVILPRLLHWEFVIVAGGSMEPAIPFGSIAIMEQIDGDEVAIGDIIKFRDPAGGHLVTHRVIGVNEDGSFVTRGDANPAADARPVPPGNVEARYLSNVPHVGSLLRMIASPAGYVVVVLVPGALIILFEVASIVRALLPQKSKQVPLSQPVLFARMRPVHGRDGLLRTPETGDPASSDTGGQHA